MTHRKHVLLGLHEQVPIRQLLAFEGRKNHVQRQFERVVKHTGHQCAQPLVGLLETGVGVDLDEPGVQLLVDHEVVAKDLEAVLPTVLVQLLA